ncbi:hypothetical protein GCM10010363_71890 [Streptomyces omiyaensis]|uniref:hypothetical protein n=1 Tax=Streptomyces omiyaensis TaxID=68247 RepID=UPI00167447D9|nr:hypothetical protein [Streptomyces omiyaensis]GGY80669.1 hypothetical protein GCM10010363_71890 [Streptomyces omiyaensis]
MLLVVIVAVLALLAGLAANRWLRPRLISADDDEGMAVKDLVGPLLTMTVLLLSFVLLITLVITVAALGFCLPRRNNRGQIVTLVVITALLTTALCIIRDVDRPFGGIIDVEPTAITEVERQAERDFTANHPATEVPCDDQGNRRPA